MRTSSTGQLNANVGIDKDDFPVYEPGQTKDLQSLRGTRRLRSNMSNTVKDGAAHLDYQGNDHPLARTLADPALYDKLNNLARQAKPQ